MYYLNKIVSEFPETIYGIAVSPAAEHLFTVKEDKVRKLVDKDQATAFHHSVVQFLFTTPPTPTLFRKT